MEKIKKISYIGVTSFILVLIILVCNITIEKRKMHTVYKTVTAQEYAELPMTNCHSEIDKNGNAVYFVDANYPVVSIQPISEEINCIEIKFKYPLKSDLGVGLYYQKDDEGFSESQATHITVKENEDAVTIFIPKGVYGSYMLSITDGEYSIDTLNYGIAELKGTTEDFSALNQYYKINWIGFAILVFLFIFLAIFEKKYRYYLAVKHIFLCITSRFKKIKPVKWLLSNLFVSKDYKEKDGSKARRTANTFAVLALVFGFILIYIVPPMTTPDEVCHYLNVYRISEGAVFASKSAEGNIGVSISNQNEVINNFIWGNFNNYAFFNKGYSFEEINNFRSIPYNSDKSFVETNDAIMNPAAYIFPTFGVVIFKLLFHIVNPYDILIAAKISNLILSIIIIRLAILKTPIMRNSMFLIALNPITLYLLCSVNYDVMAFCGSFLLFAYSFKLIMSDDTYRIKLSDVIAICFASACLFSAKLIFIILTLMLFAISIKKFGSIKKYLLCIFLIFCIGLFFYLIPTKINQMAEVNYDLSNAIIARNQEISMIKNIRLLPTILYDTMTQNREAYINSFIGLFGWDNVLMPIVFINSIWLIDTVVFTIDICSIRHFKLKTRILSFITALILLVGVFMAMYLTYLEGGNFGITNIGGMHGRYFIPFAIYIPLFLANPLLCRFKYAGKIQDSIGFITKCTSAAYLLLTCAVIFTAYWL